MNYQSARTLAQEKANRTGRDYGVEKFPNGEFSLVPLPEKRNRYGRELRCEVVYPENLDRCQKGHGPCA